MNASSNAEHFFETDAAQAKREKRKAKAGNKFGNPIALKSKILAAIEDPFSPYTSVFVALSTGRACRVNLETSAVTNKYQGPTAPVCCVAVSKDNNLIFGGSWDKTVWSWDITTAQAGRKFVGHSDFAKALLCAKLGDTSLLISGGSDKKIIVWDAVAGTRLHTMQDPTMSMLAVQYLALDPILSTPENLFIVSASSDPHIRRWMINCSSAKMFSDITMDAGTATDTSTILEHETSVYKVFFDCDPEEANLWTASADGTVKCLSRDKNFAVEKEFKHGDYVRAVVVTSQWVATAGRDEDIKVWDRESGDLYCKLEGHFDEITDLVLMRDPAGKSGRLCSVSIDGTMRTWPLEESEIDEVVEAIKAAAEQKPDEEAQGEVVSALTAEEEAELAELMDDD